MVGVLFGELGWFGSGRAASPPRRGQRCDDTGRRATAADLLGTSILPLCAGRYVTWVLPCVAALPDHGS